MLVKFKDLSASASKLATNGQNAATAYKTNAVAAAQTWQDNTAASSDNYTKGVQDAISRGAFAKGVASAGAGKYSAQVQTVGGTRFSDGMSKAGPAWQKGFAPIAAAVQGKDIGPRGPRGSAQNKQRAANMADAFRAAKLAAA